jgi:hypothetical protein
VIPVIPLLLVLARQAHLAAVAEQERVSQEERSAAGR